MRVAIVTPEFLPNWGGIGTYTAQLAMNLPSDFEVHVISLRRGGAAGKEDGSREILDRISLHTLGTAKDTFIYNSQFQVNLLRKFRSLQSKHGFDILHANHAQMPDIMLKVFGTEVPSVTTIHTTIGSQRVGTRRADIGLSGLERSEKMTYLLFPAISMTERFYLQRCRDFIFVSEYILKYFEATFRKPPNPVIVHNGVDPAMFRPRESAECLRHFPMLDGLENIILFSGRMIALKGLDTLIASFSRVLKDRKAHLVFAGVGKFDTWRRMLIENGVPESRFVYLSQVPYSEMPYLYALASVFVLPSYSESFPMTVLEAMSSGTPIVASKVGGIPEMIRDKMDGYLVDPGNPLHLTNKILDFLSNRPEAARFSRTARERILDEFSAVKMAAKTAEIYRRIAEDA